MRKLPDSLLRALSRLDYHALGLVEALALRFAPSSPESKQQEKDLHRRHPALGIPSFTAREKKIYYDAIRNGATADQALEKIVPLSLARKRRALKRTKVPAEYRQAEVC